jgi:hypothetical protein
VPPARGDLDVWMIHIMAAEETRRDDQCCDGDATDATLFSRVDFINLELDVGSRRGFFLRLEPSSPFWNSRSPSSAIPPFVLSRLC